MDEPTVFERIEKRAFDARRTMAEICSLAGVAHSTWCRAKKKGYIRATTVRRIEGAISFAERQAANA